MARKENRCIIQQKYSGIDNKKKPFGKMREVAGPQTLKNGLTSQKN